MGRGGFMIHPHIKGMEEEFTHGENVIFYKYGDFDQLREYIDYYLEHHEEREKIRKAGHEFVKKNATYTNRLQEALDIIFHPGQSFVPDNTNGPIWGHIKKVSDELIESGNFTISPPPTSESDISEAMHLAEIEEVSQRYQVLSSQSTDDGGIQLQVAKLPIKISLGAGTEPEEGFVNVDIVQLEGIDVVHNLMQYPWPFEDSSAEYIKAKDIIEHMATHLPDGRSSLIAFIEEAHRILQPGGTLWIQTPAHNAPFLWIDPTHVRGYHEESFDFFDPETDFGRATGFYSDCTFKVTHERLENGNLQFTMVKR
jgi:SAM-dependent methyltransferase